MPGARSLETERYYFGPGNRFWTVMGTLFDFDAMLPYEERVKALNRAGVALWDVIRSCKRRDSLDASIIKGSEVPNDFLAFFREHDDLRAVTFNGRTAFNVFRRTDGLALLKTHGLQALPLPSTSAVNTHASRDALVAQWEAVLQYLRSDSIAGSSRFDGSLATPIASAELP